MGKVIDIGRAKQRENDMGAINKYAKKITDLDKFIAELVKMRTYNNMNDIITDKIDITIAIYERQKIETINLVMKSREELL